MPEQTVIELNLSEAIEQWCDQATVAEVHRLEESHYPLITMAAIFGEETTADRQENEYCRAVDKLRAQALENLSQREWIGSAFAYGGPPGVPRTDLHEDRWKLLQIDFENWTANGTGLQLYDIRVRLAPVQAAPEAKTDEHLDATESTPKFPPSEEGTKEHAPGAGGLPLAAGASLNGNPCGASQPRANEEQGPSADSVIPPSPATFGRGDADIQRVFVLSARNRTLKQGPCSVSLPKSMFRILELLAKRTGDGAEIVKNEELNTLYSANTSPSTIRSYLSSLRKELGRAGFRAADGSELILTHNRLGYSLRVAPTAIRIE